MYYDTLIEAKWREIIILKLKAVLTFLGRKLEIKASIRLVVKKKKEISSLVGKWENQNTDWS